MGVEQARNAIDIFQKTIHRLDESVAEPAVDNRDLAGIIKHFELCFEQAYKSVLEVLLATGDAESPMPVKSVFRRAFELGWQRDEVAGSQMIVDRNATTHTYNDKFAKEMVERITASYLPLFKALHGELLREVSKLN
jgi:nucleotidyltransferase substrate binding protein (TIGR01987 family)